MATSYTVLGQAAPAATTDTDVYTVPAATQAVVSTIFIANGAGTAGSYTIRVRVAGEANADKQMIANDVAIPANDATTITAGITLGAGDVVTVNCSSADMSVNIFGSEIS